MTAGGSWRSNRDNFLARSTEYRSGTMNFALAWYQQGMQVIMSCKILVLSFTNHNVGNTGIGGIRWTPLWNDIVMDDRYVRNFFPPGWFDFHSQSARFQCWCGNYPGHSHNSGTCAEKRNVGEHIGGLEHPLYCAITDEQQKNTCPSGQRIRVYRKRHVTHSRSLQ